MAFPDLWNETFEGTGFTETWGAIVDAGAGSSTLNEDALSSAVSSPGGWGTNCFLCTVAAGGDVVYYPHSPSAWTGAIYFRMEVVVTAESLANDEFFTIFSSWDSGFALGVFSVRIYQRSTGNLNFQVTINKDGTSTAQNSESGTTGTTISLNQRYRLEIKYDITNDLWEWRVDGNTEYSGALTSTHPTDISEIRMGINSASKAGTYYIDNVGFGNTTWLGPAFVAPQYAMSGGMQELSGGIN